MTKRQFEGMFPDDDNCKDYLVAHRRPSDVRCPRCCNVEVYGLYSHPLQWQCEARATNGYRFSVLVGTIFENTKLPLRTWFRVIHIMVTSKKRANAVQVHRVIATGTYRSAWYMCYRIHAGMTDVNFQKLLGIVEVGDNSPGEKSHNNTGRRCASGRGGVGSGNSPVAGAISRKRKVVARVIETVSTVIVTRFIEVSDLRTTYRLLKGQVTPIRSFATWPASILLAPSRPTQSRVSIQL